MLLLRKEFAFIWQIILRKRIFWTKLALITTCCTKKGRAIEKEKEE